jgi:hypothetical protein
MLSTTADAAQFLQNSRRSPELVSGRPTLNRSSANDVTSDTSLAKATLPSLMKPNGLQSG